MFLLCLCLYLFKKLPSAWLRPSGAKPRCFGLNPLGRSQAAGTKPSAQRGDAKVSIFRRRLGPSAGRPLCGFRAATPGPFDNVLLDLKRSKQKIIWRNCLIAFSGGQDSINLVILWKNLLAQPPWARHGGLGWGDPHSLALKNKPSIIWCNHIWKTPDFYLFRHSFQISFLFNQRFFYTIFFSKYFSEKKARKWRYFSFLRVTRYSSYDSVLTAHTQSDSIETFFINLFRGSGQFGLQTLRNLQIFFNYECSQTFY